MADTVREMGAKCRNWSRWGPTDELGTLNYIAPETIVRATRAVRRGVTFSLAIPFDNTGPQINQPRRFNPIHRMILTGPDFTTGAFKRPGGVGFADDMVIMALQCGTQWDALSHCFLDGRLYNGYDANLVSSEGAKKNGMEKMARFVATRGVLLDLRSEEHTSELQSLAYLVCRLLLEKKKKIDLYRSPRRLCRS